MNEVRQLYFDWMYKLVSDNRYTHGRTYRKLMMLLHGITFDYTNPMDVNRFDDGIDLRYRFGYENDICREEVKKELDWQPCSVLEMMIALAIRCEEYIMDNPAFGNRTGKWFFDMITNLGLIHEDDSRIDIGFAKQRIERFLDRDYCSNGEGGLFVVRNTGRDLRTIDIWYQAMWYLNNEVNKGGYE